MTDARTPANQLAEARFLASRLRELADQGIERGAMVVLLRAFTRLDAHEDSLERAGLRPYVVGGRGYWSQQQVADVCACWRRSPTHSTTRRCWARSPRSPAE